MYYSKESHYWITACMKIPMKKNPRKKLATWRELEFSECLLV